MNKRLKLLILVMLAIISFCVLAPIASSPKIYKKTIVSLDEKRITVTELAAASAATSSAITLLPGETATPIANELTNLTSYFMLVLGVIYLEKYLLTIIGFLVFKILVPMTCILSAMNLFYQSEVYKNIIRKIMITGILMLCIIPISERISGLINQTYEESMQLTLELVKEEVTFEEDENGGISAIISKVKNGVTNVAQKIENVLINFIEAIAVMLVTSCLIPIIVWLFFAWLIKFIYNQIKI